jgi:hypothetical protein
MLGISDPCSFEKSLELLQSLRFALSPTAYIFPPAKKLHPARTAFIDQLWAAQAELVWAQKTWLLCRGSR